MSRYQYNDLFTSLGFYWDRSVVPTDIPTHNLIEVSDRFDQRMSRFVWDAMYLEGNAIPFSYVQVMVGAIKLAGRKPKTEQGDIDQAANFIKAAEKVSEWVRGSVFAISKDMFCQLNGLVAYKEALESGTFRGEGQVLSTPRVSLGCHGDHIPPTTEAGGDNLTTIFTVGTDLLSQLPTFEKALVFFLFGALQQFFFDGNKRTSRLMMNGVLLSAGIEAISIPGDKEHEFNDKMVDFYLSADATAMIRFLVDCHPQSQLIWALNPSCLSGI